MNSFSIFGQQVHGYDHGHEMLYGSIVLPREDQDAVDRLSDIAGALRPSESFSPYLTLYPLPSQTHYVAARTWHDRDAPRAGCVLTQSMFVPMSTWESSQSLFGYIPGIEPPARAKSHSEVIHSNLPTQSPMRIHLPIVREQRLPELVEALFLEPLQPIVVFNSPEAEPITLRILTALWSNRRRTFAACTWCLSPRRIAGRDFDLMFSPSDARLRFSDWGGRRIEGGRPPLEARHRWTQSLTSAIFDQDQPNLSAWDHLGLLKHEGLGDEAALRLSLMWQELEAKASTTPNAVLGLLDILNSYNSEPTKARHYLEPLVLQSVSRVLVTEAPELTWKFFNNLLAKLTGSLLSRRMLYALRKASLALTTQAPHSALAMLRDLHDEGRDVPSVLAAGIGDGLSHDKMSASFIIEPIEIPGNELLQLLANSKKFASVFASAVRDFQTTWADVASDALGTAYPNLAKRVRRNLLPNLDSVAHEALLESLLENLESAELVSAVRTIGQATQFEVEEFDSTIVRAARTEQILDRLRKTIIDFPETKNTNRFLGHAFNANTQDISWLLANISQPRMCLVLRSVLEAGEDSALSALMRDRVVGAAIVQALTQQPRHNAALLERLLNESNVEPVVFLEAANQIYDFIEGRGQDRLGYEILKRALVDGAIEDIDGISWLLDHRAGKIEADDLIALLIHPRINGKRIGANLAALSACCEEIRRKVVSRIDQVAKRLTTRGAPYLDEDTYRRWADLIEAAKLISESAHLKAVIAALEYGLKHTQLPLSNLILVSFPTVYRRLSASKGKGDLEPLSMLLFFPMTFFSDLDATKKARRELVEAFMASRWPPAHLMLAAMDAGIEQKILRRVWAARGGERYIKEIWEDAGRLQTFRKEEIRSAIRIFRKDPEAEKWA